MNTSTLLFGLQAPLQSLTAKALLPCRGNEATAACQGLSGSYRLPDEDFPAGKGSADLIISASWLCRSHPGADTRAMGPTVSRVAASACLTWDVQHNTGLDGLRNYCVALCPHLGLDLDLK